MATQMAAMEDRMMSRLAASEAMLAKLHDRVQSARQGDMLFQDVLDGLHFPKMSMTNTSDAYIISFNLNSSHLMRGIAPEDVECTIQGSNVILSGTKTVKTEHSYSMSSFQETIGGIPLVRALPPRTRHCSPSPSSPQH
jgi:hypothetical protein